MLKIACRDCSNCCCHPHLTPVLLPSEEDRFAGQSQIIQTSHGPILTLKKTAEDRCIFLNERGLCAAYGSRPLECRIYPLLLDFDQEPPGLKLDKRFCPHLKSLKFDEEALLLMIRKESFSADWILAYGSLDLF